MAFDLSGLPWHTRVRNAIEHRHDVALNDLLALPETRTRFRGGFMLFGGKTKVCFAEMCQSLRSLEYLERVLNNAPGGVTFDDVCSVYDIDESSEQPILMGLHSSWPAAEEAVRNRDHKLLDIVLRVAPNHPSLQTGSARLAGMTVHSYALVRAMQAPDSDLAADMFEMSRALHAAGAPVCSNGPATALAYLFSDTLWTDVAAEHAERRLRELVATGSVDVNAPLESGLTPLQSALQAGNGHGAAALMRAGCSIDMAGTGFEDVISCAQGADIANPTTKAKAIALVTQAYMSRRLQNAPSPTTESPPPTRRARAV